MKGKLQHLPTEPAGRLTPRQELFAALTLVAKSAKEVSIEDVELNQAVTELSPPSLLEEEEGKKPRRRLRPRSKPKTNEKLEKAPVKRTRNALPGPASPQPQCKFVSSPIANSAIELA